MAVKQSVGERTFELFNTLFMTILMFIMLYPLTFVAFASLSSPSLMISHKGLLLWPKGFSLESYKAILNYKMIFISYKNTIIYVAAGTLINVVMTALAAYGLSRKGVLLSNGIMFLITFTMFFGGGLIPSYLLIKDLGLINSRWALLLPGMIGTTNLIIMRTSFKAIPVSLEESARLDGANDFVILFRIIIPLSMPVIAVMTLYYGVGHWNSWFNAMIYLQDRNLFPLQLILREILIDNSTDVIELESNDSEPIAETIKYATIMVATIPILFIYPFIQKYFVKGVMIGAIKQ
ncbi:carbohydrate ABC transporter permease [Eubacteriales bacterium mix99]|jgi:putative aldouronate transport system permease protein|nr:sugar ABC transporter permease [Clostridiales bacterium]